MRDYKIDEEFQHNLDNIDEPFYGQTNDRIQEIIRFEGDFKDMEEVAESTYDPSLGIRTFFSGIGADDVIIQFTLIDDMIFFTNIKNRIN